LTCKTTNNKGGAIYLDAVGEVQILFDTATLSNNVAGSSGTATLGHGGVIHIENATTSPINITFTTVTMSSNSALGGNGGIVSTSSTSGNTTIQLSTCTLTSNKANIDGGVFSILGSGDHSVTM
jgi:surface antigen